QVDANGAVIGVQVVVAGNRLAVVPAAHVGGDEDALAHPVAFDIATQFGDLADDLVTGNTYRAGRVQPVPAVQDAQIGAADVGRQDAQQDLVRRNQRARRLLDAKIVRAVVDGGEQRLPR